MGSLVKEETVKRFQKFNSADIVAQREIISKPDGIGFINMLFDVINACSSDNFLMMYVIPTIDGIILGK